MVYFSVSNQREKSVSKVSNQREKSVYKENVIYTDLLFAHVI
jgi:hypothetical protein